MMGGPTHPQLLPQQQGVQGVIYSITGLCHTHKKVKRGNNVQMWHFFFLLLLAPMELLFQWRRQSWRRPSGGGKAGADDKSDLTLPYLGLPFP